MNPTVLLVLALAVFAQSAETDNQAILDLIKSGVEIFNDLDIKTGSAPSSRKVVVDNTENKNFIFKLVAGIVATKLETPIAISNITRPGLLDMQNVTISGLNNAWLKMSSPSGGYVLNNLTLQVPEVIIEADSYTIQNLDLGVIVLDGMGKLRISIKNLVFTTKLTMQFVALKFQVINLNILSINADSSEFGLENLGNSSQEISKLLNGIAGLALPKLVKAITNDLGKIIEAANGDCSDTNLECICAIIGAVATNLKNQI